MITLMRGCDMGPLITEAHRDKVASYIDLAKTDGATVVVDGRNYLSTDTDLTVISIGR